METAKAIAVILALTQDTTPLVVQFDDEREDVTCAPADGENCTARPLQIYDGAPLVAHAIGVAREAGAGRVTVVTRPALASAVRAVVRGLGAGANDGGSHSQVGEGRGEGGQAESASLDDAAIDVVALSVEDEVKAARAAANFELFGVPAAVLDIANRACDDAGADYVYLTSADQPRITAQHLWDLGEDWKREGVDIVLTWARITRTTPMLIAADFLRGLAGSDLCRQVNNGVHRGITPLRAFEHDSGWAHLLPSAGASTDRASGFFDDLHLSALEAVRIAKLPSDQAERALENASDSDRRLVEAARTAIMHTRPSDAAEQEALARADAFGHRNKRDFPLFAMAEHRGRLVYLDSSATTQRLAGALEAQHEYDIHGNANIRRSVYGLTRSSTAAWKQARSTLFGFINSPEPASTMTAKSPQLSITTNATAALNLVARAWGDVNVSAGDTILAWESEHHSNLLPWLELARRTGATLRLLPFDATGAIDQAAYEQALSEGARLVCCAHVGNVLGMEYPIAEMARRAHDAHARFVLDATQSLGHGKVDVAALGVDFVAFSAHKMYGPTGIGGLWMSEEAFAEMGPGNVGGGMVMHVTDHDFEPHPGGTQYEAGTQPVSLALGWAAACEYLKDLGFEAIQFHDAALIRHLMRGLCNIEDLTVYGDHTCAAGQTGPVAFSLRGLPPTPLVKFLDRLGIAVRGGSHCALPLCTALGISGSTRISLGVYNTAEDIEAAVAAIALFRDLYLG